MRPHIGIPARPDAADRNIIKKRFPEKMDESRLDAAVALYRDCAVSVIALILVSHKAHITSNKCFFG